MDLINHLNRNRNKDEIIEESLQNHLAYCCAPSWHSCKTDKVLKVAIPVDIPVVFKWKETDLGWNEGKMTEPHLQRPKKVEPIQWGCYLGARQWRLKPQSIILRPWNLWNLPLLGCKLARDSWSLYSFLFLWYRMRISYPIPIPPYIAGSQESVLQVHRWEGFCPRMEYTWSHTYTWSR